MFGRFHYLTSERTYCIRPVRHGANLGLLLPNDRHWLVLWGSEVNKILFLLLDVTLPMTLSVR